MVDTAVWTAGISGVAALSGVVASVLVSRLNERSRVRHDVAVRQAERLAAAADRLRTFEIENLLEAYDAVWRITRAMTKAHLFDLKVARTTEHGYGGTLLPDELDTDPEAQSQAVKAIRLILDDEVRRLAESANSAASQLGILGAMRGRHGPRPVTADEGEQAFNAASDASDAALRAIASRVRALMAAIDPHPATPSRIPQL